MELDGNFARFEQRASFYKNILKHKLSTGTIERISFDLWAQAMFYGKRQMINNYFDSFGTMNKIFPMLGQAPDAGLLFFACRNAIAEEVFYASTLMDLSQAVNGYFDV